MAGTIQGAISGATSMVAGAVVGAKKLSEDAKQAEQKASAQAEAEKKASEASAKAKEAMQKEAKDTALEADLIRMGADPESASAFMNARALGLDTKQFGMIRQKGKFVGSYSSLAEKLSKDSLTDSFSSRLLNQRGFEERLMALGGTRQKRVEALVSASKGGKK